jgi:hypothetical protein
MNSALISLLGYERLDVREHTQPARRSLPDEALAKSGPACRFDALSCARIRGQPRNEVGLLLASSR